MRARDALVAGLGAALLAGPALAADITCNGATKDKLYVNVTGVKSSSGLVAVTLYANSPKRFLARHGSLGVARVPAQAGTTRVCIVLPGPGRYAAPPQRASSPAPARWGGPVGPPRGARRASASSCRGRAAMRRRSTTTWTATGKSTATSSACRPSPSRSRTIRR